MNIKLKPLDTEMTKAEISEQISVLLDEVNELYDAMETLQPGAAIMTLTNAIAAAHEELGELQYRYHKTKATPAETVVEDDQEHAV